MCRGRHLHETLHLLLQGACVALNTISVANIGVSGVAIANSTYQLAKQDGPPSTLQVLQLTSSFLFFGNAVYNYRTANNIINEAQANTFQKYWYVFMLGACRSLIIYKRKNGNSWF